jgi:hypothetical protein
VHLVAYRSAVFLILIAFSLAYVVFFLRVVFDIPVALRFCLSALPAIVLYRAVFNLRMLLLYGPPLRSLVNGSHPPWLLGFLIIVTGIASLVLYHLWRDVNLEDVQWRRESDVVPLLGRDEIRPNTRPSSRGAE